MSAYRPTLGKMNSAASASQARADEKSEEIFGDFSLELQRLLETLDQKQLDHLLPRLTDLFSEINTAGTESDFVKSLTTGPSSSPRTTASTPMSTASPTPPPASGNPLTNAERVELIALRSQVGQDEKTVRDYVATNGGNPITVKKPGDSGDGKFDFAASLNSVKTATDKKIADASAAPKDSILKSDADAATATAVDEAKASAETEKNAAVDAAKASVTAEKNAEIEKLKSDIRAHLKVIAEKSNDKEHGGSKDGFRDGFSPRTFKKVAVISEANQVAITKEIGDINALVKPASGKPAPTAS